MPFGEDADASGRVSESVDPETNPESADDGKD